MNINAANFFKSGTSNSILVSAGIHIAILVFIVNGVLKNPPNMVQPFKTTQVNLLDESEKKKVQAWLDKVRKERNIQPQTAAPELSSQLDKIIQNMYKEKPPEMAKINKEDFKLPPDLLNLDEKIGNIMPVIPDKPAILEDKIRDVARIDKGMILVAKAVEASPDGGPAVGVSSEKIELAIAMDDTAKPMALIDKPIYIARDPGPIDTVKIAENPSGVKVSTQAVSNTSQSKKAGGINDGEGLETRIIGELQSRKVVRRILPDIPKNADIKTDKIKVGVKVTIVGSGKVKNNLIVEQTSGYDYIDKAVKDAIMQWEFEPLPLDTSWQEQIGTIEVWIKFI